MNRFDGRSRVAGILLVATLASLPGCSGEEVSTDGEAPVVTDSVAPESAPELPVEILGAIPDFELVDQNGASFGSGDLHGHPCVVSFISTRDDGDSPRQTALLARLQRSLLTPRPGEGRATRTDGIRLVSITVDPDHDTASVLNDYAAQHRADPTMWTFLTGDRGAIWQLCQEGFKLPLSSDPMQHDTRLVLLDRTGRIRGYYDGLSEGSVQALVAAIEHVMPEFSPPTYATKMPGAANAAVTHLAQPGQIIDVDWLEEKREAQLASTDQFEVYWEFGFSDRIAESGITFVPQILDEQRHALRVNHYDHAYGVSIADVDNDGLSDIYFLTQVGGNELWRNIGGGRFENVTERAGVAVTDRVSVSGTFADTDNDGDADLYVTTVRGGNLFFENDGTGKFTDRTAASGLGYVGHSSTPVLFDYDRDGLLDVFLTNVGQYTREKKLTVRMDRTNSAPAGEYEYWAGTKDAFARHLNPEHSEASILFHNEGGNRFADVSEAMNLVDLSWTGDATPIDANSDGWLDLYVPNMQGHDQYYESVEGKRFVKKSRELFPKTPWGAMGVKVFDWNNDGVMDLYLTDMHSDMSIEDLEPDREKEKSEMQWPESFTRSGGQSIYGNAFFQGNGDGTFREVSDEIGAENYWPWGLSVGDLNADGFEDVFLSSGMCFPYRYGVNSLLLNNRGQTFLDAEFIVGVEPRPDGRLITPWFELDADGRDSENAMAENRSGKLLVWSAMGSRSSVIFDLDGDGDLDIVTNDFNTRPMVLVSDLAQRKPDLQYLNIKLVGSQSNRDGLGCVVRVHTGDRVLTKVYDGKSGYLSQSLHPLYFGLDSADVVDRIEVTWPSGTVQSVAGPIETNRLVEITEEA